MRILGLDEAGRGCVLGPLVVGGFLWEGEDQAPLREAGADDSKVLSAQKRAEIQAKLQQLGQGHVRRIEAPEIDAGNLNELEIRAFLELVRSLSPDRVFLDAPVNPRGIPKLRERLIRESGVTDWVIEPKADATYPVVGAASIYAKLTRDAAIEALGEVGSGYPSDPVTRKLLSELLAKKEPLPPWVRSRWGTLEVLKQQRLF
ncbi:MAG TPA: ribonuclease HII [Myxococcota bacterium]|nr:ribonuclease HII [Myxococcota bacterium]HND29034.1 ribonuclease HII [Myxococcota bacterium]